MQRPESAGGLGGGKARQLAGGDENAQRVGDGLDRVLPAQLEREVDRASASPACPPPLRWCCETSSCGQSPPDKSPARPVVVKRNRRVVEKSEDRLAELDRAFGKPLAVRFAPGIAGN